MLVRHVVTCQLLNSRNIHHNIVNNTFKCTFDYFLELTNFNLIVYRSGSYPQRYNEIIYFAENRQRHIFHLKIRKQSQIFGLNPVQNFSLIIYLSIHYYFYRTGYSQNKEVWIICHFDSLILSHNDSLWWDIFARQCSTLAKWWMNKLVIILFPRFANMKYSP